ncbi:MAG: hypothetical protein QOG49_122, partial [Frankiaceae bacterium]|nr:hypothetical protein [Frankiaceae bacterium]
MTTFETGLALDPAAGGIKADQLAVCLRVLAASEDLPVDHPHVLLLRRATSRLYKDVKLGRRKARRDAVSAADRAVVAATATGAADRIDDETRGVILSATSSAPTVGVLQRARPCYICK